MKYVVQSTLIHTLSVYDWPISLIRDLEREQLGTLSGVWIDKRKLVIEGEKNTRRGEVELCWVFQKLS